MTNNIEIYQTDDGQVQLQLRLEQESLWLTQAQMAELFETSSDNISLHLKNIYQEQELQERATTEDFSVVRQEGKRQVQRRIKHYNLDAIISVGYRVSSNRATQFRSWSLLQGYDEQSLSALTNKQTDIQALDLDKVLAAIGGANAI